MRVALLLGVALASASVAQDGSRLGQPVFRPDAPSETRTYGFLAGPPVSRVVEPGVLEVSFATVSPSLRGRLYLGLSTLDEELDQPRYRISVDEPGEKLEPITEHRIRGDFRRLLGYMPNTERDSRIEWRVEVFVPAKSSVRFVEGRTYFDPETLDDTANVTFGPFVALVGTDSATVFWEVDRPCEGSVRIDGREIRSEVDGLRHTVRIEDLVPDTAYAYRVRAGETLVRSYSLRTATTGSSFRFAAMVDSREGVGGGLRSFGGCEALALRRLTAHAWRSGAGFVVFAGDLINGYTTSETDFRLQLDAWRRAMMPVWARIPVYAGIGNHETLLDAWRLGESGPILFADKEGEQSVEAVFADVFVHPTNGPENEGDGSPTYRENVYWFDHGNARIFVLNNNYWYCSDPHRFGGNLEGYVLPNQIAWLRQAVARADEDDTIDHLFFAAQEPVFPNGGHTRDSMWYSGGDTDRDGDVDEDDLPIVQCRNELWEIVSGSAKSVAFITGDEHAYSRLMVAPDTPVGTRAKLDGTDARFRHPVWQITAGGAGAPWYDKDLDLPWSGSLRAHCTMPHVAMFAVDGGDVTLEVIVETGQVVDSHRLREDGVNRRY
jgi:hypothetical protein